MFIVVRRFPEGPRCWVFNQRVHHGPTCLLLALLFVALRKPLLVGVCAALCAHDRHDLREWFRREILP